MEKSREEVMAERKIRKAAKQAKKKGLRNKIQEHPDNKPEHPANKPKHLANKYIPNVDITEKTTTVEKNKTSENSCNVEKNPEFTSQASDIEAAILKTQLKAERRAKQEAQRALKAQKKIAEVKEEPVPIPKKESSFPLKKVFISATKVEISSPLKDTKEVRINDSNKVKMVSHLYLDSKETDNIKKFRSGVHKSVVKLGVQYKNKVIIGSNARVVAFLNTLKQVLADFTSENNFPREFEAVLEHNVQYLRTCRPPSVSMTNAVTHLKWHLLHLPSNTPNAEAQIKFREVIDEYIKDQIYMAGKAICITVQKKISQDDVILTFGYSSLIERILIESFRGDIKFRVIVVDAAPLHEGKELLRRLVKQGLHCTYVLSSAASYIMKEATKVLLGAHALLTNGYVMSRAGSSQVALIARSYNVPVLVCCETHKFSERVQTDALVYNELGDPETLIKHDTANKSNNYLKYLTLMYDVTPSDLVTAVVTELAILPCTSVPAVLRVKPANPILT